MSDQIWAALHEDRPYDLARHVAVASPSGQLETGARRLSAGKDTSRDAASSQGRQRGTPPQPAPRIEKAPQCEGLSTCAPRGLEPPRTIQSTRPSTRIARRRWVCWGPEVPTCALFWTRWTGWTGWMLPRCCATTMVARPSRRTRHHGSHPDPSAASSDSLSRLLRRPGHPHFHARHAEGAAKIRIDVVEVIGSNLPTRQLRIALAWAELNSGLLENWRRARAGGSR